MEVTCEIRRGRIHNQPRTRKLIRDRSGIYRKIRRVSKITTRQERKNTSTQIIEICVVTEHSYLLSVVKNLKISNRGENIVKRARISADSSRFNLKRARRIRIFSYYDVQESHPGHR